MSEYRHIGKVRPRQDGVGIVTGKAIFSDDTKIPGALYVKVLHSPHPHAEIISIDTSAAEALPGVKSVMTYKNAPAWKTGTPAIRPVMDSHIRYVGDTVASVCAVTNDIAEEALDLIKVEYKLLEPVYDVEDAIKPGAPEVYRDEDNIESKGNRYENNCLPPGSYFEGDDPPFYKIVESDAEKGIAESDAVAEGKVSYDKATFPGAPEAPFVAARWDDAKHVTVWASSQGPNMVSQVLSLTVGAHINVITSNVGGSYGNKDSLGYVTMLTVAIAKVAGIGQAVRYYLTKEEQLITYERRLSNRFIGKVGINKDGIVNAVQGDWLVSTGVCSELTQGQVAEGLGELHLDFNKTPNWDLVAKVVASNVQPVGIARGFGGQELKACILHLATRAMKELDLDPYEVMKKNFCSPGSPFYWRTGHKYTNPMMDYGPAFEAAAEKFRWYDRWKGWNTPSKVEGNKRYGVGFSVHSSGDPQSDDTFAYVRIEHNQVIVHSIAPESGMGQRLAVAKTVAEIMNISLDSVSVLQSDTKNNPADFGLTGSRGTITSCAAAGRAAEDAKAKLMDSAANILECKPEELDTKDMMIFKKADPNVSIPWIAVCPLYFSISGEGEIIGDFKHNNCVMTFIEVEVDIETGLVKVTDCLSGSDVGQIMNPLELKMQFEGGLGAAGIDTAQLEEHIFDARTGRTMTHNLIDYKWRPFNELPNFETSILESQFDTANPFHAIGIGEIVGAPGIPAMMMAIEEALGGEVELNEYPVTPDVLLKALNKA